jgi:hypothetical protein
MLRLALLHRLRGGLTAEAEWRERAFALEPSFRDAYDSLLSGDGTEGARGAPDVKISGYFAAGLR